MHTMRADESDFRLSLLVVQSSTSSNDTTKNSSLDDGEDLSNFMEGGVNTDVSMNLNERM